MFIDATKLVLSASRASRSRAARSWAACALFLCAAQGSSPLSDLADNAAAWQLVARVRGQRGPQSRSHGPLASAE